MNESLSIPVVLNSSASVELFLSMKSSLDFYNSCSFLCLLSPQRIKQCPVPPPLPLQTPESKPLQQIFCFFGCYLTGNLFFFFFFRWSEAKFTTEPVFYKFFEVLSLGFNKSHRDLFLIEDESCGCTLSGTLRSSTPAHVCAFAACGIELSHWEHLKA